jgi:hypothetical protein
VVNSAGDNVILFDPDEMWVGSLVSQREARSRVFSGFSEIRIRTDKIECDYTMSNGKMASTGTFVIGYRPDDPVDKMTKAVTQALGDAFKKFERIG